MQLLRFEMVNYCNHEHTVLDFRTGVTAIVGRNGAGKSSVLDGLRVVFTGETANVGAKSANIRWGIPKSAKSYLVADFKHGDVTAKVTRSFKPAKPAVLEWSAGPKIEGEAEVNAAIQRLIGVDAQTLHEVVLVSQKDLFGFITQTNAERAKYFQSLFGLQAAERTHDELQKYIRSQLGNTNWQVDIDAKREQQAAAIAEASDLILNVPGVEADTNPYAAEQHQLQSANQNFARWQSTLQIIQSQTARVQDSNLRLANLTTHITTGEAEIAQVDKTLQDIGDTSAYAATVQLAQRAKTAESQRAQLLPRLQALLQQLAVPIDLPRLQAEAAQLPVLEADATEKAFQYSAANRALQSAVCATCQRPLDEQVSYEARAAVVAALLAAATEAESRRNDCRQQVAALQQWQTRSAESENLQNQMRALDSVAVPADQLEAAKQLLQAAAELIQRKDWISKELENLRRNHTNTSQLKHGDECQIATLQLQAAEFERQCAGMNPAAVQARLAEVVALATAWDKHSRSLAVLRATVSSLDKDIAVLEHRKLDQAAGTEWLQRVEKVAALFHREAAPRFVSYHNLQKLEREMNRMLELFCANFRLTAKENLSFEALFFDGRVQPVERLSGGQATMVAMIFRLAVNTFFAGNVGLIFLDEPTAFIDEHHMRGFEPVLASLRDYAAGRGLQCVMITHAKDLAPLFDQTIKIGE
jgi:DNA repair exonuclease SbcCD ATPase subunit